MKIDEISKKAHEKTITSLASFMRDNDLMIKDVARETGYSSVVVGRWLSRKACSGDSAYRIKELLRNGVQHKEVPRHIRVKNNKNTNTKFNQKCKHEIYGLLRIYRNNEKLTFKEMDKKFGTIISSLSGWENGQNTPKDKTLEKIICVLKKDKNYAPMIEGILKPTNPMQTKNEDVTLTDKREMMLLDICKGLECAGLEIPLTISAELQSIKDKRDEAKQKEAQAKQFMAVTDEFIKINNTLEKIIKANVEEVTKKIKFEILTYFANNSDLVLNYLAEQEKSK
jgi:transcriptional regulator with XRE-family HTH domain